MRFFLNMSNNSDLLSKFQRNVLVCAKSEAFRRNNRSDYHPYLNTAELNSSYLLKHFDISYVSTYQLYFNLAFKKILTFLAIYSVELLKIVDLIPLSIKKAGLLVSAKSVEDILIEH